MTDDVIQLATRLGQKPPIAVAPRPWDGCAHPAPLIDTELRTVDCDDCGARLDPIEVLIGLAKNWSRWTRQAELLREYEVRAETRERERWERSRDRHLHANPTHRVDTERHYWSRSDPDWCRICQRLEVTVPLSVRGMVRQQGDGA